MLGRCTRLRTPTSVPIWRTVALPFAVVARHGALDSLFLLEVRGDLAGSGCWVESLPPERKYGDTPYMTGAHAW